MSYRVEITRRAMKGLAALPANIRGNLSDRIAGLSADAVPQGTQPLHAPLAGCFKLRVGDYRVVYKIEEGHRAIVVLRVGHRHNVYK
jgi:mRNA interferase RelE/StbE